MIDAIRQYTATHNREDENSGERKTSTKPQIFLILKQEEKEKHQSFMKEIQALRIEENINSIFSLL